MKPLVSILIPCYNSEKWLAKTLQSAIDQTWEKTEIIVIDDGSTDNSLVIARQFESSVVKVISQSNHGASSARNRALQEAQGDFIQYLDADDLLEINKIELQLKLLLKSKINCIASGEWARFYNHPSEAKFKSQPLWADFKPVDWLVCAWEGHWMMHPSAWLIPRTISEQAGFWNETLSLNDDGEYFCRVVLASQEIKFCSGAKVYYRSGNSNSLSGTKSYLALKSAFYSLELGTSNLLTQETSLRTRKVCATVFQRFIYEIYPIASDLQEKSESYIKEWGGSDIKPNGGPTFQILSLILGWKRAKLLQNLFYKYGYRRLAIGCKIFAKNLFKLS